jgi:hypothetical protein
MRIWRRSSNRLRPAVFDDLELVFRQIGDRLALLIRDDHIDRTI